MDIIGKIANVTYTEVEMVAAVDEENGVAVVAYQDYSRLHEWYDSCGTVVATGGMVTNHKCRCDYCQKALDKLDRLKEAWNGWNYNTRQSNSISDDDALNRVIARAGGIKVLTDHGYHAYGVRVEDCVDYGVDYYVIDADDSFAEYSARDLAASINGSTWAVGTIPLDEFRELIEDEALASSDLEDVSYGFTWKNIDRSGYSTPTERELFTAR